jgi:hypothetical protein
MPDFNDHASEVEQQTLADQLEAQVIRASLAPKVAARGVCLNPRCGEEFSLGDPRLYCNSACAAEHARLSRK